MRREPRGEAGPLNRFGPALTRRRVLGLLALAPAAVLGPSHPGGVPPAGGAVATGRDGGGRTTPRERFPQCRVTGGDVEGPFYLPGAPTRTVLAAPDEPGQRVVIRGRALAGDCVTPLAGVKLDLWQADADGNYHGADEAYRLRGVLESDAGGEYAFESVLPGRYRVDGSFRPAHIHFVASKRGYSSLVSQIYFKGDPYLAPNDACGDECRSDDPARILELMRRGEHVRVWLEGTFDVVLERMASPKPSPATPAGDPG